MAKIVWIEVGRRVPRYAKRNFRFTQQMFGRNRQDLVTDSTKSFRLVNTAQLNSIEASELTKEFREMKKDSVNHQDYFWLGTTARFFHLYDYMVSKGFSSAIHAETDVIILDLDYLDELLKYGEFGLAYPLQNESFGVASVFLVKEISVLKEFLEFILENWMKPRTTDMSLLYDFSNRGNVLRLPSNPDQVIAGSIPKIFDAGAIGPFFMGTEARNHRRPFSYRGFLINSPFVSTSILTESNTSWRLSSSDRAINLVATSNGISYQLVNLHLHSKKVPRSIREARREIYRGFLSARTKRWRLGSLDFVVLLERVVSYALRKLSFHSPDKNFR